MLPKPPDAPAPGQQPPRPYIASLDGLRAAAVAAVVLFHTGALLPGGAIGVDVFLVLSGFLITTLLTAEFRAHRTIDLRNFYLRRLLRLYPALLAMLAFTLVARTVMEGGDAGAAGLVRDAAGAVLYVGDVALGWGLMPEYGSHLPILHTWSLAIEEHFYLLWAPLLLVLLCRRPLRLVAGLVAVVVAVMTAWSLIVAAGDDEITRRLIYSPDTRGVGLMIGALLALQLAQQTRPVRVPPTAAWCAAAVLVTLTLVAPDRPLLAVAQTVAAGWASAVVIAGALVPGSSLSRVLSLAPARWVGRRSYGIYIWHFPIFHLLSDDQLGALGPAAAGVVKLAALGLAVEASYRFVELPLLRERDRFKPRVRATAP